MATILSNVMTENAMWSLLAFLIIGIAIFILGRTTDILRDSEPVDFAGAKPPVGVYRRPYSLAQTQMAWWFCIIIASYVFIWLTKHSTASILTSQSLVLMGIGIGTAVGAAVIEQTKTAALTTLGKFKAVIAAIAALPSGTSDPALTAQRDELASRLASENFFKDILSDVDGISLHRFQSVAWTAVLGVIFVVDVVSTLAMPEFDQLTLAVLGISCGTYLGFKIPEQPA